MIESLGRIEASESVINDSPPGRLIVLGSGLQPARHAGPRTVSEIRHADTVFAVADGFALDWLQGLSAEVRDLGGLYADDLDRRESYAEMQRLVLEEVRKGRRVCLVLYGHPGVFAQVGHKAMAQAGAEGFETRMEPGISAEACLYADLGLDPGEHGVQSFEATQFLVQQRRIDPASLLLLWQISQTGNIDCTGFDARPGRVRILVDKLLHWHGPATETILYEAATLPIQNFRAERVALSSLPDAVLNPATTLVIPPSVAAEPDQAALRRLAEAD